MNAGVQLLNPPWTAAARGSSHTASAKIPTFPLDSNKYHCPFPHCGMTFVSYIYAHYHYSYFHAGQQLVSCPDRDCNFSFLDFKALEKHWNVLHNEDWLVFKCIVPDCDYAHRNHDEVIQHVRDHHEIDLPLGDERKQTIITRRHVSCRDWCIERGYPEPSPTFFYTNGPGTAQRPVQAYKNAQIAQDVQIEQAQPAALAQRAERRLAAIYQGSVRRGKVVPMQQWPHALAPAVHGQHQQSLPSRPPRLAAHHGDKIIPHPSYYLRELIAVQQVAFMSHSQNQKQQATQKNANSAQPTPERRTSSTNDTPSSAGSATSSQAGNNKPPKAANPGTPWKDGLFPKLPKRPGPGRPTTAEALVGEEKRKEIIDALNELKRTSSSNSSAPPTPPSLGGTPSSNTPQSPTLPSLAPRISPNGPNPWLPRATGNSSNNTYTFVNQAAGTPPANVSPNSPSASNAPKEDDEDSITVTPAKKPRGRPKKSPGDPKAPYTRKTSDNQASADRNDKNTGEEARQDTPHLFAHLEDEVQPSKDISKGEKRSGKQKAGVKNADAAPQPTPSWPATAEEGAEALKLAQNINKKWKSVSNTTVWGNLTDPNIPELVDISKAFRAYASSLGNDFRPENEGRRMKLCLIAWLQYYPNVFVPPIEWLQFCLDEGFREMAFALTSDGKEVVKDGKLIFVRGEIRSIEWW